MKAIETFFDGYRFRSRLEARWAVFFKTLGVQYEYEKEGYDLDGVRYLPDFWLPTWNSWVEIKSVYPTEQEIDKCRRLSHATEKSCIVIWGEPWAALHHKEGSTEYWDYRYRAAWTHPKRLLSTCQKDGFPDNPDDFDMGESHIFTQCRRCPAVNWLLVSASEVAAKPDDGRVIKPLAGSSFWAFGALEPCCDTDKWPVADVNCLPRFQKAYTAARQARFEHGEVP